MALLLLVEKGSILFGTMRMQPVREAGWRNRGDDSYSYDLRIGAELVIEPGGKELYLQTSTAAPSQGGALTRAVDEAEVRRLMAGRRVEIIPILYVGRLGELKPLGGVGWTLGKEGWELPFEKPVPGTSKIMALFIATGDYESRMRLEVREYSWPEAAMSRALKPPKQQQICPNCNTLVRAGAKFCGSCGTKL